MSEPTSGVVGAGTGSSESMGTPEVSVDDSFDPSEFTPIDECTAVAEPVAESPGVIQVFLSGLAPTLSAFPGSSWAERARLRQLSPEQMVESYLKYCEVASSGDPLALFDALDKLIGGTAPYAGNPATALYDAEAILEERRTEAGRLFEGLRVHMRSVLEDIDAGAFDFNEDGTARLLVRLLEGRMFSVPELGGPLFYGDGSGLWRREDLLPECVRFTARVIHNLPLPNDPEELKRRGRHVAKLFSAQGVRAIEYLVLKDPRVISSAERFDQRPDIVVFNNGTHELETGIFRGHRPEDMATIGVRGNYNPKAVARLFKKIVAEALDGQQDDALFFQKWVGYCLSGFTDEQVSLFVPGPTNTSKSTIFGAIHHAFGGYSRVLPVTTLMQQRERTATNDLASLRPIRNTIFSEVVKGARLDEALYKTMVSQDPITARLLYHEYFTFLPQFKVNMHTNFLPIVNGADTAVFRRMRVLPFLHVVPADDRDPALREKLQAEADGILQWAIEGFRLWRAGRLGLTSTMAKAVEEYQRASDSLADFLDEGCIVEQGRESASSDLYHCYEAWAKSGGIDRPMTQKSFGLALKERGFTIEHGRAGNKVVGIEARVMDQERIPF